MVRGNPVARPAGALRRLEEHAPAVQPLGQNRDMGTPLSATDADNEYAMIDRPSCGLTSSPAPVPKKRAEDQTLNRGRGGLSTKIHALIDALGNPVRVLL